MADLRPEDARRVALEIIAEAVRTLGHGNERQAHDYAGAVWFFEAEESPFTALASGAGLDFEEIREANREALDRARRLVGLMAAARQREGREPIPFEPTRASRVIVVKGAAQAREDRPR